MKATVEYTDTFGGEANYGWCRQATVEGKGSREIIRKAKAEMGLTGVPCRKDDNFNVITLWPRGMNTVMFINFWE